MHRCTAEQLEQERNDEREERAAIKRRLLFRSALVARERRRRSVPLQRVTHKFDSSVL